MRLLSERATLVVTAVVSVVIVGALLRVVGGPDVLSQLGRIGVRGPLIVALAWVPLLGAQTLRWRASVVAVTRRPFVELALMRGLGNALNAFLPARAGDVARIELLARRSGVDRRTIAGVELVDLVIDKLGWLPAMLVVAAFGHPPHWLVRAVPWIAGAGALGLGFLFLVRRLPRVPRWLKPLQLGLVVHSERAIAARALLLGPLPWLVETTGIMIASHFAGVPLDLSGAFAALTAMNLAYAIPIPANAGTIEVSLTGSLTARGIESAPAMAFAVAYHIGQVVPMVLVGLGAAWWLRRRADPSTVL
ncbi:hypothetical protein BH09MYX1_BH09MYX1_15060 [soil metagenome]